MRQLTLLLVAMLLTPPFLWAETEKFPGIEQLMSDQEFNAAGLDRLSKEELEALNGWLVRYTAGEAAILRQDNEEVQEASEEFEIISRIKGNFRGWSGETVFRLENGQVWRQRLSGSYVYTGPPNPEVRISRNWLGFYKLTLVEAERGVGVSLVD